MLIYAIEISQTASSGVWSFNTVNFTSAILLQIIIESASTDTTFDLTLTDNRNHTAYRNEVPITGKLIESVTVPFRGIYTVAVANASADELFSGRLLVQEI